LDTRSAHPPIFAAMVVCPHRDDLGPLTATRSDDPEHVCAAGRRGHRCGAQRCRPVGEVLAGLELSAVGDLAFRVALGGSGFHGDAFRRLSTTSSNGNLRLAPPSPCGHLTSAYQFHRSPVCDHPRSRPARFGACVRHLPGPRREVASAMRLAMQAFPARALSALLSGGRCSTCHARRGNEFRGRSNCAFGDRPRSSIMEV